MLPARHECGDTRCGSGPAGTTGGRWHLVGDARCRSGGGGEPGAGQALLELLSPCCSTLLGASCKLHLVVWRLACCEHTPCPSQLLGTQHARARRSTTTFGRCVRIQCHQLTLRNGMCDWCLLLLPHTTTRVHGPRDV